MRTKFVGVILCVLIFTPLNFASAESEWSDNFNDKDLEGWGLETFYTTNIDEFPVVRGKILVENQNNRLFLPNPSNSSHVGMNGAYRNSTQVHGYWGFDVDITDGSMGGFMFIYRDVTPETDFVDEEWYNAKPNGFEGYFLGLYTEERQILLARMDANFTNSGPNKTPPEQKEDAFLVSIDFADICLSPYGVFHIDITRTPSGNITVYLNSIKIMSAIDTVYNISEQICISNFLFDTYYDNIEVNNDSNFVPDDMKLLGDCPPSFPPIELILLVVTGIVITAYVVWFLKKGRKE
ncbi:MAG: hypothetical protein ACFE9A_19155 [Candidatus Hodarchaeota archaeon]